MSSNVYGREMFTVVPIEGMEAVRKNFVKYQNSEETVRQLFGSKKAVPLWKRFQLVERGYAMLLKDDVKCASSNPYFSSLTVSLNCGSGKENSGKESLTPKRIGDEKREEVAQKAQPLSQKNH